MADIKCEAQTLREQKFGRENVLFLGLADLFAKFGEFEVVIFGLGAEEQGGFEDVTRMIGHYAVGGVETFEVLNCRCLIEISMVPIDARWQVHTFMSVGRPR